ncbi:MAG: hypothetical protein IJ733_06760 [Lachnospiraceae bacterium]|nr:hypothetical protein [Lachnospiraceae bacterium]
MYYILQNRLDADNFVTTFWSDEKHRTLADRLYELIETLDGAYDSHRKSFEMGGYVLIFPDYADYKKDIAKIEEYYKINPSLYEYRDIIGEGRQPDGKKYREDLYLLSSDDSLVFIYPGEQKGGE